jgi:hypothetical protein
MIHLNLACGGYSKSLFRRAVCFNLWHIYSSYFVLYRILEYLPVFRNAMKDPIAALD